MSGSGSGLKDASVASHFDVRVVSIDHYMAQPIPGLDECYSQLGGCAIDKVPVVRIFGSTPGGQKTCVHIHGAFPYFYVPLEGAAPETASEAEAFLRQFAAVIEAGGFGGGNQGPPARRQRLFAIQLVRGRKFYGYHAEEQLFIKMLLYNPTDVGRISTMLQEKPVMGRFFQPHESHIPYLLQFKIDFNLFGMGFLKLGEVHFRNPVPAARADRRAGWNPVETLVHHEVSPSGERLLQSSQLSDVSETVWVANTIPNQWLPEGAGPELKVPARQSCCELEVDVHVEHILNRRQLVRKPLETAGEEEQLVESLVPMWEEERRRSGGELPPSPPPPPRTPELFCQAAEDVRAQYQRIAEEQMTGATPSEPPPAATTPLTRQHQTESATPLTAPSPGLVGLTPAANAAAHSIPRSTVSPAARAAWEAQRLAGSNEEQADLWAHAGRDFLPPPEEMEEEMRELMQWMQDSDDAESGGEGLDPLLSLARHADSANSTPLTMPASQKEALHRANSRLMSQAQREVDDILEASQADNQLATPPNHSRMRLALQNLSARARGPDADDGWAAVEEPGTVRADLRDRFATGVFAESAGDAEWEGLSAELDQAMAEAQAQAEANPMHEHKPSNAGRSIPQTDGSWDSAIPHSASRIQDWPPARAGCSPAESSPQSHPSGPPLLEASTAFGRETRQSLEEAVEGVAMEASKIPQVDGGGDAEDESAGGKSPPQPEPPRYAALSVQQSSSTTAAQRSPGQASVSGRQRSGRAASGSEASSRQQPQAVQAPFRPPRPRQAVQVEEAAGRQSQGVGLDIPRSAQSARVAPYASLPLEAARGSQGESSVPKPHTRSRLEVRRAHALASAARALLGEHKAAGPAAAESAIPATAMAQGREAKRAREGSTRAQTHSATSQRDTRSATGEEKTKRRKSNSPAPSRREAVPLPVRIASEARAATQLVGDTGAEGIAALPAGAQPGETPPLASGAKEGDLPLREPAKISQLAPVPASDPRPQWASKGSDSQAVQAESVSLSREQPSQPATTAMSYEDTVSAPQTDPEASPGRADSTAASAGEHLTASGTTGGFSRRGAASQTPAKQRLIRIRRPPPGQAELDASWEEHGLMPVVAERPHYSTPSDLPAKPPVFSGVQFRLPTSAVAELQPWQSSLPSNSCRLRDTADLSSAEAGGSFAVTTARRPPSARQVREWLSAIKERRQTLDQRARVGGAMELNPDIDPNTGMLLATRDPSSQEGSVALSDGDLLGTPMLASPAVAPRLPKPRQRSRLRPDSQQAQTPAAARAHDGGRMFATPVAPGGGSGSGGSVPQEATEEEEEVRPASPKYDERTFFYTTPQVRTPKASWPGSPAPRANQGSGGNTRGLPSGGRARTVSQISGPSPLGGKSPTPISQAGFRWRVAGKGQNLTFLSVELQADTRGRLLPDPRYDAVRCIVLAAMDDDEAAAAAAAVRVLLLSDSAPATHDALPDIQVEGYSEEREMLEAFAAAVRSLDPDMLVGWEVQQSSIGYLIDRAELLEVPLLRLMSRTPEVASADYKREDEYGRQHASGLHCVGRVVLNLWRLLRSEVRLPIHTFESCAAAILQLRAPHVPAWQLSQWLNAGAADGRWRTLQYWARRAAQNLAMLEQLDLVGRTGELARAFGIDFFSVLSRGSQYRVESLLARLAHSQNYLLLSPSREQVGRQPAMECIPLVMEPESKMYSDPVIVLDFQSLYPSQIIAYNLCFCTCLGRPKHAAEPDDAHKLGASSLALPPGSLTGGLIPDRLTISPNGVAWAPPSVRAGVVPRLLQEILKTRIMVKAAMKRHPASAKVLQRVLNARQFGLKLIANVTYGYAAAGFSGRMPMAELADAIVQSGRHTLERTIRMVESDPGWKARVVYGDTDSLFVLLPGRSREAAFRIGAEIAARATAANPPPVTLKMEKVYHPCVLASKKRYVGHMYETPKQAEATFDAKGIETVRRDSCPVVAKMLERTIRILFTTHDLSLVKRYVVRQWGKILAGRVSLADFVFAKEVRLGTYSGRGPAPPAAIVAAKAVAQDPRAEPRYAERVPYIVVHGPPGARLVDMVVPPRALVEAAGRLRLHAGYYITKQILPALERVLHLVGADPRAWFHAMARPQRLLPHKRPPAPLAASSAAAASGPAGTIDQYYLSRHCAVCDALTHAAQPLCEACRCNPQLAAAALCARASRLERHHAALVRVCLHCSGGGGRLNLPPGGSIACDSLDCGLYFERRKAAHELAAALAFQQAGLESLAQGAALSPAEC